MKSLINILAAVLILTVCGCEKIKPYIPDGPVVIPTNIPPVIPQPEPTKDTNEWGAVLSVPREDLASGEWRMECGTQIGILEVHADYWLGSWSKKGISCTVLPNGDVELLMVPMQGPSGKWYKPYSWRIAHEASAMIYTNRVICPKSEREDVCRARYECREKR